MLTEQNTIPNDFFVAGGTLRASAPSYVLRPADDELFELAAQGAFCYVLTPRQMGKSSLMIRTAKRLGEQGVRAGIVDLTQIGAKVTVEQWYLGLLSQLRRSLKLEADYAEWWAAHSALGEVQRFTDFLREVVLSEIKERVVIFIDEIDSTLQLDFRDDFFAAIRAMYNARAESSDFQRLSFVLLGVASPPDLIRDLTRTPFNIGQAIALKEFSRADAAVLQDELEVQFAGQGASIFERIFYWTNGHPYLTQKLCQIIGDKPNAIWRNNEIDELVKRQFLTEEARKESNLQNVQNSISSHPLKIPMLNLYHNILKHVPVKEDQSPIQNQLKLSGLVRVKNGVLVVRNLTYRKVFDEGWVKSIIPTNWIRRLAIVASILTIVLLSYGIYSILIIPSQVTISTMNFFQKIDPKDRIRSLATIFRAKGIFESQNNNDSAIELFYSLSWEDQKQLLDAFEASDNDMVTVIRGLYITMADVDGTGSNLILLETMYRNLESRALSKEEIRLRDEIKDWLDGSVADKKGDEALAEQFYSAAIALNTSNPATRFTRGKFFAKTNRSTEALADFNEVIRIAQQRSSVEKPIVSKTTIARQTPTVLNNANAIQTPTINIAGVTPSPLPLIDTPTPSVPAIVPKIDRFVSRFTSSGQMIVAVRDMVTGDPRLLDALASSSTNTNLALRGILPVTSTGKYFVEYYNNRDLSSKPAITGNEAIIDAKWGSNRPIGLSSDIFSISYDGQFYFAATENYEFVIVADNGTRLWVDDSLVMNEWRVGLLREIRVNVPLVRGEHRVRLEYFHVTGDAQVGLSWSVNYSRWEGRYYNTNDWTGPTVLKRNDGDADDRLRMNWGIGSPGPNVNTDDFSVIWERRQFFDVEGVYQFTLECDGGAKVILDGKEIVNALNAPGTHISTSILRLTRGFHSMQVMYVEYAGSANLKLDWALLTPTSTAQP